MTRPYFAGLNMLRFYAAFCVVLSHLENQFPDRPPFVVVLSWFTLDAQSAVDFFFVLSGFLITYLLLDEYNKRGQINIVGFYSRRAARILPLYYLVIGIVCLMFGWFFSFGYSQLNYSALQLLLMVFLMPNFVTLAPPLTHLWSIGVEQQFYLFWPWLAQGTPRLLKAILGILILKIMLTGFAFLFPALHIEQALTGLRFECMAIGGFVAWLVIEQHPAISRLCLPVVRIAALGIVACFIVFDITPSLPAELISSLAFAVLILNVVMQKRIGLPLENPVLNELGKISYGIYMYHFPVLFLFVVLFDSMHLGAAFPVLLYLGTIAGTLLVSSISYYKFELLFINLSKRSAETHPRETQQPAAD